MKFNLMWICLINICLPLFSDQPPYSPQPKSEQELKEYEEQTEQFLLPYLNKQTEDEEKLKELQERSVSPWQYRQNW